MTLADRIEQAAKGSRELDAEIARKFGLPWDYSADWRGWGFDDAGKAIERPVAFPYTTSIDAALSLVPEGWVSVHSWQYPDRTDYVIFMDEDGDILHRGRGKVPALALCAAALRAGKERDE